MISPTELQDLKAHLRQLVVKDLEETFKVLKGALPADTPRMGEVLTLEGQYQNYKRDQLRQTLSTENAQLIGNQIRSNLIDLVSELKVDDFDPVRASVRFAPKRRRMLYLYLALIVGGAIAIALYWSQQNDAPDWFPLPHNKSGHLLYKIPEMMELNKEEECIMRIAFDSVDLVKDLSVEDVKIEDVATSEKMRVELVTSETDPSFRIRNVLDKEQFLERGDYTEWRFGVTPLKAGIHNLTLKVSVMKKMGDEYVPRNIAFSKDVEVVTNALARTEAEFQNTGQLVSANSAEGLMASIETQREEYGEVSKGEPRDSSAVIELPDKFAIYFPFNAAQTATDEQVGEYLSLLAERLRISGERIQLIGHTDNVGTMGYNNALGRRRAEAIKEILVNLGLESARIDIQSAGETQPIASNETEEGRALNRRVEIRLLP